MSLFQENVLEIDNPQSREEDEELEEQKRRQEELTDLLATGIHAFNYDESTINSSVTSLECEETHNNNDQVNLENLRKKQSKDTSSNLLDTILDRNYRESTQQDQLKVLYEVRGRELKKLSNEFNQYKEEKVKEISILKNKVILSEAEIRHLQISLTNSESLLVEKTEAINNLKHNLSSRDQEVENLRKIIDELKLEICTYNSTINELQLKQSDNNPFSVEARKFNSDELQKAHQNQIIKMESLLQEQTKKTQIVEKEKNRLEEDIKKLIKEKNEIEEENNLTIMGLSKKLQISQQQCKDMYILGEAIKKESDHFKERLQCLENNKLDLSSDGIKIKKMDKETMMVHLEKLKRMLLDKDIEMNTLKAKLRFYDTDLEELFEYRKLLTKMYTCEIKPCSNSEHEEMLIFMQRQLQSYQQAVEDRNNQIITLNMVNKELQEKIEEMIQQTRTDIQNISQKYSLPQLETMNNELKNAEITINDLKKQLAEKEEIQHELDKLNKYNEHLKEMAMNEKQNYEELLSEAKNDLRELEEEKNKLQVLSEELKQSKVKLIEENTKIKQEVQKICLKLGISESDILDSDVDVHEVNLLKSKYGQVHYQLCQVADCLEKMSPKRFDQNHFDTILQLKQQILNCLNTVQSHNCAEIEEKLKTWVDILTKLQKNVSFVEPTSKDLELRDTVEELTNAKTMLEGEKVTLECQLKSQFNELENVKMEMQVLVEEKNILIQKSEENACTIQKLNDQLNSLQKCLKIVEENKMEIEKQLENTQKQLNDAKQESIDLYKEVSEASENELRKNLFKELKDMENNLEQGRSENEGGEIFKKCIQAEVLKAEILLRERLEEESNKKVQKIEEQYKNVLTQRMDMYNKEKEKWKNQEAKFRKQFASVLEECGKKMEELEKENISLQKQVKDLMNEYRTFKFNVMNDIEKYKHLITEYQRKIEVLNEKWENLFEFYAQKCTSIQKQSQKKLKALQKSINMNENEIHLIEKMHCEKIKKIQPNNTSK